jgi:hypothetical protein
MGVIPRGTGCDETGAGRCELGARARDVETNAGAGLQLRFRYPEQLGSEESVGLASTQVCIGAHRSDVRGSRDSCCLFRDSVSVGTRRSRGRLCRSNAPQCAEIDEVLLHTPTDIKRVHGSFNLSLRIEHRLLARWSGKIDAEGRGVESATGLLHVAADVGEEVGAPLSHTRLGLVGSKAGALRDRALSRRQTRGVAEG